MADLNMKDILYRGLEKKASDIHLTVGLPPMFRIFKKLEQSTFPELSPADTKQLVESVLTDLQREKFYKERELDFSMPLDDKCRFRVNVHIQRGSVEAAFRVIPHEIKSFEQLHLPPVLKGLMSKHHGLILVTGPTGSGKTTTLAAMVDYINANMKKLIICIEDPIEFLHKHKQGIVKQREVGVDTHSFANALKYALRQDPDVIMVGEMRDLETIAIALTAAETGHLVLGTLHTSSAAQTIDRLIDVFPPAQQEQIKIQLSSSFAGVISQTLLPTKGGMGLIAAYEIMIGVSAIRRLIREHKTDQMLSIIQTSSEQGMTTMDKTIKTMYRSGVIDLEVAREIVLDKSDLPEK